MQLTAPKPDIHASNSYLFFLTLLVAMVMLFVAGCHHNKTKPGLVGAWYGGSDLTRVQSALLIDSLDQTWDASRGHGNSWSAKWEGFITAPRTGEITFFAETDRHLILDINGHRIIDAHGKDGMASGRMEMEQGKDYPVQLIYMHDGGKGFQNVQWQWEGAEPAAIPSKFLRHTDEQEKYWNWQPQPKPGEIDYSQFTTVPVKNVDVYSEPGRFGGWPANNGLWSWGNEILVGFELGYYKKNSGGGHSIDREKEKLNVLARSLDGGETWGLEDPNNFAGDDGDFKPLPGNINFAHPDFAMRCEGKEFFISYDRGRTWEGPYSFPDFGLADLSSRTDYLVEGPGQALLFLSAEAEEVEAGFQDRAFCAQTIDDGKTFEFLGWMTGEPLTVRSVMPSTVRIGKNHLVSAMRRRHDERFRDRPAIMKNWIDAYESTDNGKTWKFLSKIADTDRGQRNGNPPSLIRLKDGRLCAAYGYRAIPYGIRAKLSKDNGKSWGAEIHLRDDGATWDLGYTRMMQRPDGQIVTIYYYNTEQAPAQHIVATIWDPDQVDRR